VPLAAWTAGEPLELRSTSSIPSSP
jgi:hypothetical protein